MEPSDEPQSSISLLHDHSTIITGEEDEDIVYSQRAQLLHFYDSTWNKRGLGELKILKHRDNGKLRVVMRHEDIQNTVCLNHNLNKDVVYKEKGPKSWYFVANDYSEGQYEIMQLCLRFKAPDIALTFKEAIDVEMSIAAIEEELSQKGALEFIELTAEEKRTIVNLKLPLNFFDYKKQLQCTGCRGCEDEAFCFPAVQVDSTIVPDPTPLPLRFERDISTISIDVRIPGCGLPNKNLSDREPAAQRDPARTWIDYDGVKVPIAGIAGIRKEGSNIFHLKLPKDFYAVPDDNCPGCRGCDPDNFIFPPTADVNPLVDNMIPLPLFFDGHKI